MGLGIVLEGDSVALARLEAQGGRIGEVDLVEMNASPGVLDARVEGAINLSPRNYDAYERESKKLTK